MADETLPIIGRFFPRFQVADVDSGHWVISEKPQEFRNGKSKQYTLVRHGLMHVNSRRRVFAGQRVGGFSLIEVNNRSCSKVTRGVVIAEGVNVRGIIKLKLENSEGF